MRLGGTVCRSPANRLPQILEGSPAPGVRTMRDAFACQLMPCLLQQVFRQVDRLEAFSSLHHQLAITLGDADMPVKPSGGLGRCP